MILIVPVKNNMNKSPLWEPIKSKCNLTTIVKLFPCKCGPSFKKRGALPFVTIALSYKKICIFTILVYI